jgi:NitT/TauT family transport system permease protein
VRFGEPGQAIGIVIEGRRGIMKVGLRRAMPYFCAAWEVAMTVAFVGSIISETVAANEGIGHLMPVASARFDVPPVLAGLIVTGVMGVMMYGMAASIEDRTTGWATRGPNHPRLATGG